MDLLSALNNLAIPEYQKGLIEQRIINVLLLQRLKPRMKTAKFDAGGNLIFGVETLYPIPGGAVPENTSVMLPGAHSFERMSANVKEIINPAGVSRQVMERLRTNAQGFANMPDRALKSCGKGMDVLLNLGLHGDGTGRLAQASGAQTGTNSQAGLDVGWVVPLDNNRVNFGWAAESLISPGMRVDIKRWADGTPIVTGATVIATARISNVVDAETGTITIQGGTWYAPVADNDIVFQAGAVTYAGSGAIGSVTDTGSFNLPEGIMSLCDDGATTAGPGANANGSWRGVTFQGLDRTAAAGAHLKARIYKADDWATGGAAGTLATYTLDDIDGILDAVEKYGTGGNTITAMYMTPKTLRSLKRKGEMAMGAVMQVGSGEIIPGRFTKQYNYGGRNIPTFDIPTLPENSIYLLDENQITWQDHVKLGWYDGYGTTPWFPSPASRALLFEAWMRIAYQLTVDNCLGFARIEDLDTAE